MSKRMWCSRVVRLKSDAIKIGSKWQKAGAMMVSVYGERGAWTVRAFIELAAFARYCAEEAREQQGR